ncbi:hypothetical protein BB560_006292 [Smittium megazygosporum]|uniref:Uncharacterized protein n=1 Tax=Smittium megazygosporum TaxID=133381 RepID=A0A2T9YAX4_9FUNG|nr:hypothetical protein BB560_006292 [Smittium megazygosporum]
MITPISHTSANLLESFKGSANAPHLEDPQYPFWISYKQPFLLCKAVIDHYNLYTVRSQNEQDPSSSSQISLLKTERLDGNCTVVDFSPRDNVIVLLRNNSDIIVQSIEDQTVLFEQESRGQITSVNIKGDYIITSKINGAICFVKLLDNSKAISLDSKWQFKIYSFTDDSINAIEFTQQNLLFPTSATEKLSKMGLFFDIEREVDKLETSSAYPTPQIHPQGFEVWPMPVLSHSSGAAAKHCYFMTSWSETRAQYSRLTFSVDENQKELSPLIESRILTSTKECLFKSVHPRHLFVRERGILNTNAHIIELPVQDTPAAGSIISFDVPDEKVSFTDLTTFKANFGITESDPDSEVLFASIDTNNLILLTSDGKIHYFEFK